MSEKNKLTIVHRKVVPKNVIELAPTTLQGFLKQNLPRQKMTFMALKEIREKIAALSADTPEP